MMSRTVFFGDGAHYIDASDEMARDEATGTGVSSGESLVAGPDDGALEFDIHIPEILLTQRKLIYHEDSVSIVLIVRINCSSFCDLTGNMIHLVSGTGDEWDVEIVGFNGVENETKEFRVTAGTKAGTYTWTAFYQDTSADGTQHAKVAHTYAFTYAPHSVGLAVWGIPFPATIDSVVSFKVGAKCNNNCSLADQKVHLVNSQGELLASSALSSEYWEGATGTTGLFWTNLGLQVPPEIGTYEYRVLLSASENHLAAEKPISLYATGKPEASLTIIVLDESTGRPLENATVSAHPYASKTDAKGRATLSLLKTQEEIRVTARDYEAQQLRLIVSGDAEFTVKLKYRPGERGDERNFLKRPAEV
jgi:hypothetical protein